MTSLTSLGYFFLLPLLLVACNSLATPLPQTTSAANIPASTTSDSPTELAADSQPTDD